MEESVINSAITKDCEEIFYDAISKEFLSIVENSDNNEENKEEKIFKNPNLDIAQLKFSLQLSDHHKNSENNNADLLTGRLFQFITDNCMAPYYQIVCKDLNWKLNTELLDEMKNANLKTIESLDSEIEYACNNLGVVDIKQAYLNKANYLSKIGNKLETIEMLNKAYNHTIALGCKLDNLYHCIRIGMFFNDLNLVQSTLMRCEDLIEQGADWHYRNCFKIYKGLYSLATRNFSIACEIFTSSIATFVCTELIPFNLFIKYTIISAMIHLNRNDLKKRIINNYEILQALHDSSNANHLLKRFIYALYDCEYRDFFESLAKIELDMKHDLFLNQHSKFYIKEMKIKAYNQLLSTYSSLNLSYMAEKFGVSEDYIEQDISKFIIMKKFKYKIDKVDRKIINLQHHDQQQQQLKQLELYEKILKNGDLVLTRVQKLSRVIDI